MNDVKTIHDSALQLLTRREHSRRELFLKLQKRFATPEIINQVLQELAQAGWLSDIRFAKAYVHDRAATGYGPMRLRQELMARGVADEYIEQAIAEFECDWQALAEQVRRKRFGGQLPKDFKEKAKQLRFLQYRGFNSSEDF